MRSRSATSSASPSRSGHPTTCTMWPLKPRSPPCARAARPEPADWFPVSSAGPARPPARQRCRGREKTRSWTPASLDYRNDKVTMFATFLPAGSYQYTFQRGAAFPGRLQCPPGAGRNALLPGCLGQEWRPDVQDRRRSYHESPLARRSASSQTGSLCVEPGADRYVILANTASSMMGVDNAHSTSPVA